MVGPREALACAAVTVSEMNWLDGDPIPAAGRRVAVKLRSTMAVVPGNLRALDEGRAEVMLDTPEYGVSPGQACVFYDGERVLGDGWILRDEASAAA